MCGRFTQHYTWREVHDLLDLVGAARNLEPRYNIAPTTTIDAAMPSGEGRALVPVRWGLVPAWWKKSLKEVPSTFNARAETVAEKPMFRSAFKARRCVIPASGFYEWKTTPGGKQPYYISARAGGALAIAGLWEDWKDPASGETLRTATMIVTAANAAMQAVHDRMPVFLDRAGVAAWLSGKAGAELLKPASDDLLQMWPVSKRVNRPGNSDDATLIDKAAA
jgi:putative SOS response-associated peptidase YedK